MNLEFAREGQPEYRCLDGFDGGIPIRITKEQLRKLSTLSPLRSCLHIAAEWLVIVGVICLCQRFWNAALYLATVAFIGARQHALLILMHDGTHYRLFRNRRLNDCVTELVLAWPHLIAMRSYRQNHFPHHRHLNTDQDPDWTRKQDDRAWLFPKDWANLAWLLLRDLSGPGAIGLIRISFSLSSQDTSATRRFVLARLGFYVAAVAVIVWLGALKIVLLYWLVPYFTWLIMILHVRSIAEHFAIEGRESVYAQTRTTRPCLLERIFVAPKNVNYHIEHHFYPSVPFYRLPKLHQLLMAKPEFQGAAHLTRTYWGVLRECTGRTRPNAHAGVGAKPGAVAMESGFERTAN